MDDDDEFGNLYTDFGTDAVSKAGSGGAGNSADSGLEGFQDEDEDLLLYGRPAGKRAAASVVPHSSTSLIDENEPSDDLFDGGHKDSENEEILLYGQLYGDSSLQQDSRRAAGGEGEFDVAVCEGPSRTMVDQGSQFEVRGSVGEGGMLWGKNKSIPYSSFPHASQSQSAAADHGQVWDYSNKTAHADNAMAEHHLDLGVDNEQAKSRAASSDKAAEEWDSESDDDLQIVLNNTIEYGTAEEEREAENGSAQDEEENLVVSSGGAEPAEGKEWEESPPLSPGQQFAALTSATAAPTEGQATPGEEKGATPKQGTPAGVPAASPRIGYSGQGYHVQQPHHMQFKYVRQGSKPGGPQNSATAALPGGRGALGDWNPMPGGVGRGDVTDRGGPRRPGQPRGNRLANADGGGQSFLTYTDFNLPPTKTVFDVDIDSLDDKPWRRPGADITDYFNYGFDEMNWKQYCRRLAKLRVESTMQSKIRVYESGRSEQAYDPDLPPELAAATGALDAFTDSKSMHERASDSGPGSGLGNRVSHEGGQGRGATWIHSMQLTGRAIQVEGGGAERRPSVDVRRQRARDSDAVIQILPHEPEEEAPTQQGEVVYIDGKDAAESTGPDHPEPQPFESAMDMWDQGPPPGRRRENDNRHLVSGGMMATHHGPTMGYGMLPGDQFPLSPHPRAGTGLRPPLYGGPQPVAPMRQKTYEQAEMLDRPGTEESPNVRRKSSISQDDSGCSFEVSNDRSQPHEETSESEPSEGAYRAPKVDGNKHNEQTTSKKGYRQERKERNLEGRKLDNGRLETRGSSSRQREERERERDRERDREREREREREKEREKERERDRERERERERERDRDRKEREREREKERDREKEREKERERERERDREREKEKERERERKFRIHSRRDKEDVNAHSERRDSEGSYRVKAESVTRREARLEEAKGSIENGDKGFWGQKKDAVHDTTSSDRGGARGREGGRSGSSRKEDSRSKDGLEVEESPYSKQKNGWPRGSQREQYTSSRYSSRRSEERSSQPGSFVRETLREPVRELNDHHRGTDSRSSKEDKESRVQSRKADDGATEHKSSGVEFLDDVNVDYRRKRKTDALYSSGAPEKASGSSADDHARGAPRRRGQEQRKRDTNDTLLVDREEKLNDGSSSGKSRHQPVGTRPRKKVVGKLEESNSLDRQPSDVRTREYTGTTDTAGAKGAVAAEESQLEKKKQQQERSAVAAEERKERFRKRISEPRSVQSQSTNPVQAEEVKHERPARKRRWGSD